MAQIKSKKRVKQFGEVYTADREVRAMCDLIPAEVWSDIRATFLEPSCGNGNFLVEIYARKLAHCETVADGLVALESIHGIDILSDNVVESRARLLDMFDNRFKVGWDDLITASYILCKNIICGDSLQIMAKWQKEATP